MLSIEMETAIALARAAGSIALSHYHTDYIPEAKIGVDDHSEPVTIADIEASRLIVDGLRSAFPADAVLSEEEPDDLERRLASDRVWIIDPIDGTAGFVKMDGDFAVHIGLILAGKPVLGVVFLPYHDTLIHAVSGNGTYQQIGSGPPTRVIASDIDTLTEMTAAFSRNHPSPRTSRIIEHFSFKQIVRRGSVGLKVGLIADRTCDIYIHPSPRTKLWDTCAPQIIIEEAGGRLTDIFGEEIRYDLAELRNLNGILASNGAGHTNAVERLRPLLNEFGRFRVPYVDNDARSR